MTTRASKTRQPAGVPGTAIKDNTGRVTGGYDQSGGAFGFGSPAPTPVQAPTAAPAPSKPFRYTEPPTSPTTATSKRPVYQEVDEGAIREATRKRMQSSIDAINAEYANLVARENVAGQDRSGQTRAINARSGLMGSDFGAASQDKTTQFNQQQVKALQDEKLAKIDSVLLGIEDRASRTIAEERAAADQKYAREFGEYEFAQEDARRVRDEARVDLKTLAQTGYNLDVMDPNQKAELFRQAGYDDPAIGTVIFNAYKPKPEQIDYQYIEQRDGSILAIGQDPLTGQLKREIIQGVSPDVGLVIDMIAKYPDAQILPTDDVLTASQKIQSSRLYREQVRPPQYASGGGGSPARTSTLVDANGKPLKLTAGQVETLSSLKTSMSTAQSALALLEQGVKTGPISGNALKFKKLFGNADENQLKLEQTLGKLKADFMKALSGAAVSEPEVKRLASFLPSITDQENVIRSKLNSLMNETRRTESSLLETLGASAPSTSEIRVRQKATGQTGTIPANEFDPELYEQI